MSACVVFGFISMTTCDLAQRLGDGAEEVDVLYVRIRTCACPVVRLASVRSGRLWVWPLGGFPRAGGPLE